MTTTYVIRNGDEETIVEHREGEPPTVHMNYAPSAEQRAEIDAAIAATQPKGVQ